jgi:hypothetical protein
MSVVKTRVLVRDPTDYEALAKVIGEDSSETTALALVS